MSQDSGYDLIIVGSGGGSFCAALAAKAEGLRPLIIEKTDKVGGSTALSGGIVWIPNNPLMARDGLGDTPEDAWNYLEACAVGGGPGATVERRRAFLDQGPAMCAFLEKLGMAFVRVEGWSDYHVDELPGGSVRGRTLEAKIFDLRRLGAWEAKLRGHAGDVPVSAFEMGMLALNGRTMASKLVFLKVAWRTLLNKLGKHLLLRGSSLQGRMLELVLKQEIDIWTNAKVTQIISEGGRVTGVLVDRGDGPRRIDARRGVLINSGGFSHNAEMRQAYQPTPATTKYSLSNPGDTGEVLNLASAVGADMQVMDLSWWIPVSVMPDGSSLGHSPMDMPKPHAILVDKSGKRFVNEATSYVAIGIAMHERHKTVPAVPAWYVLDSQFLRKYRWGAGRYAAGDPPEAWITSGYMKRGATVEELARACGIDPAGLAATVDRYNGFAKTGVDEDFGKGRSAYNRVYADPTNKPSPCLGPIETGPFYAVEIHAGDVGTAGGVVADEYARALTKEGRPIPGLYATGNATAPVGGRSYPGAGTSIGASMVFGYIAARHAAGSNA